MTMKSQAKVFIAGSRRLSRLSAEVKRRIDNIVEKGFVVIIGDAHGVDKAVQQYLDSRQYDNVIVFYMEGGCRNNVGDWATRTIVAADPLHRDFAYYSTKDRVMVGEADYGFMLWDGRSRGTLSNIFDLVRHGKPVVVYLALNKTFYSLHRSDQLGEMLSRVDPSALHRVNRELRSAAARGRPGRTTEVTPLF